MTDNRPKTRVVTGKVRFSYCNLFEPRAMNPADTPKYSVSLLIPKEDKETMRALKAGIESAKEQWQAKFGKMPPTLRIPIRDGDTDRPDDPAYQGHYFINASSTNPPGVVDRRRNRITDSRDVYSGCYGRASINFFPYKNSGNAGIGAGLNNIQKLEDGEPLGGATRPEDDFEAVDFDDEDDFLS